MSWKNKAVEDYFKSNINAFSYMHFLNRNKATFIENTNSKDDLKELDAQLFGLYKMLLPEDAPASALKRWGAKKSWEGILVEHSAKEEFDKVATVSKKFQISALDLLDDARGVSVLNIRKRLLRTANQEDKSSASTSINNINISNEESNHHDIDNPFLDHTAEERVRSKIMNFKIQTDHVAEIHKQE